MSDVDVTGFDDEPQDHEGVEVDTTPAPPAGGARSASILGALAQAVSDELDEEFEVYPIGKVSRLLCRYRALRDDEAEQIAKQARGNPKLRQKTGQDQMSDIEVQNRQAALMLVTACVEIIWVTDQGDEVPLHEYLQRPEHGLEDPPTEPLRYSIETLEMLMPDRVDRLRAKVRAEGRAVPTSVDVAAEMHRWGEGENHAPLRARGSELQVWSADVSAKTIRTTLGG